MKTGIFGYKGRVHFQTSTCINEELEALRGLPKTELFAKVSELIDRHIHRNYRLYPGNFVACDLLETGIGLAAITTMPTKRSLKLIYKTS